MPLVLFFQTIYLGIALAEAPRRPDTHHADAQNAHGNVDVRLLLRHDEEAHRHHTQTGHDQPVPVRLPLRHRCLLFERGGATERFKVKKVPLCCSLQPADKLQLRCKMSAVTWQVTLI